MPNKLPEISADQIKAFLDQTLKTGSHATYERKLASLGKFFAWAKKEAYIISNPIEEYLAQEENQIINRVSKAEEARAMPQETKKPFYSSLQSRIISKFPGKPKIQDLLYKAFYSRPNWYQTYHSISITNYFHLAILIIFCAAISFGVYDQMKSRAQLAQAYPAAPTTPKRYLSFQGRLTNEFGNPTTIPTTIKFELYDSAGTGHPPSGGNQLWDSGDCEVTPDQDGIFSVLLGTKTSDTYSCPAAEELTAPVFSEHAQVWLHITTETQSMDPRVQIATVAYALNTETLQGLPAGTGPSTIPFIDSTGKIVIGAAASPTIESTSGTFAITSQAMTISTANTTNGAININPDGTGALNLTFEGAAAGGGAGGFVNATDANLTSGALYYGSVASNAPGYDLLQLRSGSPLTTKFSVNDAGKTYIAGDLGIGTTAPSNELEVVGDIELTNLYDNDASNFFDGGCSATETVSGIDATGAITCTSITGVPASSVAFTNITSGSNTQANMSVGTGAALNYAGSGTINASSLIGATWAAPLAIGGTTAAAGTFTTVTANTGLVPDANDGAYLGQAGTAFSDLFLAEGGVINWDSGDATLTQTGNVIALAGADFDAAANIITNIGNAGTDFVASTGALNLAAILTMAANASITLTSGTGQFSQTYTGTTTDASTLIANSLTSGDGYNVSSTGTAFTGNLIDVTLSGSNAANTGSLLMLTNSGTSNTNTAFYIKHYATGTGNMALRVDDVSADITPFVIDGAGNVGVGTTAPTSPLSVGADSQFQVDANGDIIKLKNLVYSWPSSHTASGFLQDNGSGTLSWTTSLGSSTIPFTNITSGTNVQAAMWVGAGASLTYAGGVATDATINANKLLNATWAAPLAIGGTTAAAGTFTTVTANTGLVPDANDGAYLGQAGTAFSDLFLAEGGVINWDSGDATLTQTGNVIALAGADFDVATNIITNIGNTGTDFVATTGALNLAGLLTMAANAGITMTSGTGQISQTYTGTTVDASTLVANSLTSGDGYNVSSTGTAFTGNLIDVTLSGSNAANTGSLLMLTNSGTSNTNTAFYIKHYATGTGNMALRVDDVSADITPFVIDGAGNVGIGTTAPVSPLSVGQASPFQVDVNGDIIKLKNLTYAWPSAHTASGFLQDNGSGTLSWTTTVPATSIAFSGITSGTNTTAAMWVGPTASLTYTGGTATSGVINANQLLGATWAAPLAIGGTTAAAGTFTTVTANTGLLPDANDDAYLGQAGTAFADLFLAEGGVINWDSSDATLTQTGNVIALAGADFDANANIITNIGNTGTDFVATTGALNLAGLLTMAANAGITMTSGTGQISQTYTGTTVDASTLVANSLTSGDGYNVSSTGTAFTGNLIDVTLSGSNAANTGSLLMLTNSGTSNTNTAFYIKHYATGTGNMALRVDDVSADITPFVIDGAGNVGIGTTAPVSPLSVGQASPFQVDVNGDIIKLKNLTYAWPSAHTASGFLQDNGSGTLSWTTTVPATSIAFSGITSGTNTTAAMWVGPTASLTYTGGTATSGVINANQLLGATWAAPLAIGGTTAAAGTFTTVTANTGLVPDANDGAYLGQAGTAFSDLFLAEGGVINWDSGDATLTQTGNVIALAGADFDAATNIITNIGNIGTDFVATTGALNLAAVLTMAANAGITLTSGTGQFSQTYTGTTTDASTLVANSLTSGDGYNVSSTGTAVTGNLIDVTLSGSNAANTGSLLMLTNSGVNNTNTTFYIKHYATGTGNMALRVDDESGDTTPFVITGAGNVGIGTTAPAGLLTIGANVTSGFLDNFSEYQIVLYPNATAATSYGFGVKSNTMVFNSNGGAYSFDKAGASTEMVIDTGGDVGIGTTAPGARLDIVGDGTNAALEVNNTGTGDGIKIYTADATANNGLLWYQGSDTLLNIYSDAGNGVSMLLKDNDVTKIQLAHSGISYFDGGNVGIGTTNPLRKLHVVEGSSGATSHAYSALVVENDTYTAIDFLSPNTVSQYIMFGDPEDDNIGQIEYNHSTNNMNFKVNGGNKVTIDSEGNVGIGTTSPADRLSIQVAATGDDALNIYNSAGTEITELGLLGDDSGYLSMIDGNGGGSSITLRADGGPNYINSGNVGIGTTAPGYDLDVAGNINLTGTLGVGTAPSSIRNINSAITFDNTSGNGIYNSVGVGTTISSSKTDYGIYNLVTNNANIGTGATLTLFGNYNKVLNNDNYSYTNTYGSYNLIQNSDTSLTNTGSYAGFNYVLNSSTGTLTNAYGTYGNVTNDSTGTITNARGLYSNVRNDNGTMNEGYGLYSYVNQDVAGGTMTDAYGGYFQVEEGAGTLVNAYGLYVNIVGTPTTEYGLYVTGETQNYFSGNVGIGDVSPDAKLEVLATTEQLRLTNVDDTADARFTVSSTGDLTINMLGSGSTDQLVLGDTDTLNIGSGTASDVAYNLIANTTDTPASTAITSDNDLFVGGDLELKGGLYLTGRNIYNVVGGVSIGAISFAADPTAINSYNSLSYGSWLVQNLVNDGIAALMVNQGSTVADIFTASSSATLNATPGVTRFVITNAGDVGIGTAAPDTQLHLSKTDGTAVVRLERNITTILVDDIYGGIEFEGQDNSASAAGVRAQILAIADDIYGGTGFAFRTTGGSSTTLSDRVRIDSDGNVGIGTVFSETDTTGRLNVRKDSVADGVITDVLTLRNHYHTATNIGNGIALRFKQGNSTETGKLVDIGSVAEAGWSNAVGFFVSTGGSERLRISNGGNVGIGTTAPNTTLELGGATAPDFSMSDTGLAHGMTTYANTTAFFQVEQVTDNAGGARLWGFSNTAGLNPLRLIGAFGSTDPTDTIPGIWLLAGKRSGTGIADLGALETVLQVGQGSSGNALMTILGSGNVGIGTTAPGYDLDVAGNINLTGTLGVGTGTPTSTKNINSAITFDNTTGYAIYNSVGVGTTISSSKADYGIYNLVTNNANIGTGATLSLYGTYNLLTNNNTSDTVTTSIAGYNYVLNNTTGTITTAYGTYSPIINNTTGNIDTARAFYGYVRNDGGTITDAYGGFFRVDRDGGTITNGYGVYVSMEGTMTNNYGLYVTGETQNYFSGNVGIGETTPAYLLELTDNTDTPTFGMSDDDVAHGVTTIASTDTFFHLTSASTTVGGAVLTGLVDTTGVTALTLKGVLNSNPTDTTPAVLITGHRASGTGVADLAAAETVFAVANNDDAKALVVLGNGNVGIGTTAPGYNLDVADSIAISGGSKGPYVIGPDGNGNLEFNGGIDSSYYFNTGTGYVGIGNATPAGGLEIGNLTTPDSTDVNDLLVDGNIEIEGSATATTGNYLCITTAGVVTSGGSCSSSSIRFKEDVQTLSYGLAEVLRLNPVSFIFDPEHQSLNNRRQIGFIAEEVLNVIPELVEYGEDGLPSGLDYAKFTSVLVSAVQEQQIQIASLSGQLADLSLTDTGDLNIAENTNGNYQVTDTSNDNSIIDRIGAFAEIVAAKIRAGAIETKDLAAQSFVAFQGTIDNLLINNGLVSPIVQTDLISPLADKSDVTVQIGKVNEDGTSGFGKLIIKDATGSAVASIDSSGSAEFRSASISGELYAESIASPDLDKIQELLRQVKEDQDLLAQAKTWETATATTSGQLDSLTTGQLFVTGQAAVSSLSISNSLSLGTDLVIQASSINTLTAPLALQSLAMAPVEIMAGKIIIATNGDVTINANLFVAGKIESGSVKTKEITTERLVIANSSTSEEPGLAPGVSSASGMIKSNAVAGTAVIPAGLAELEIENSKIENSSLIYVTPTSSTENNVLFVKSKEIGKFVVGFNQALDVDVTFNWWVIQVQN